MPKVDWITWKTDINEIMNPQKLLDSISEKTQEYHAYINSVIYEGIDYEMKAGGLSRNSLYLNGKSFAYDQANKVLNTIEKIKIDIEELKKKVREAAEDQKQIEKEQLIMALKSKLEEEEKIKENTISLMNKIQVENNLLKKDDIEELIEISSDRITQLEEKLERVKLL